MPQHDSEMTGVSWEPSKPKTIIWPPVHVYLGREGFNGSLFVEHRSDTASQSPSGFGNYTEVGKNALLGVANGSLQLKLSERLVFAFHNGDYVVDSCHLQPLDRATGIERSRLPLVSLGCPLNNTRLARKPRSPAESADCASREREWPLARQLDVDQCDARCSDLQLLAIPAQVLRDERTRIGLGASEDVLLRINCDLKLYKVLTNGREQSTNPSAVKQLISRLPLPLCKVMTLNFTIFNNT